MIFQKLSRDEQHRAALPVLLAARAAVMSGTALVEAIQEAGEAGLACHWARQVLQLVVPSATLQQFQADLSVKQSDRTRAIDRAIRLARRAFGHRGGWSVSPPVEWLPRRA